MSSDGTLFGKVWQRHVVADLGEGFALLHVDRHVVPDFNGNAFTRLGQRGLSVRHPELTFATADHSVSTDPRSIDPSQSTNPHVVNLRRDSQTFGVKMFDIGEAGHGIVHVITPEMGLALPGLTVAIGDSHTCTHGAVGALAWGVGQGELVHILATQTCVQHKPRTMRVTLNGPLPSHVSGKDLILYLIGQLGVAAGKLRTEAVRAPVLQGQAGPVDVYGFVELVEPRPTRGQRLTLRVTAMEKHEAWAAASDTAQDIALLRLPIVHNPDDLEEDELERSLLRLRQHYATNSWPKTIGGVSEGATVGVLAGTNVTLALPVAGSTSTSATTAA